MVDLAGRVALVTGAAGGLGRSHALLLAAHRAKVIVNDLGEGVDDVVAEIEAAGGIAIAARGSVTDFARVSEIVEEARARWGRLDIVVNNAGLLRDRSFQNMTMEEFKLVVDVHLFGAVHCTKAAWSLMREQRYGRIVMTTSSSGLYGNFGQANYGAAKMALVGLMQTLALEGAKYDIRVNCLAPTASTRMMEGILPPDMLAMLRPELVSPAVLALVREEAPTRTILCAGAGAFEAANVTLTRGIRIEPGPDTARAIVTRWDELTDRAGEIVPSEGGDQARIELTKAGYAPVAMSSVA